MGIGSDIKTAMDRALQSAKPLYDLFIDGVISQTSYFFVFGFDVTGTTISRCAEKRNN